MDDRIAQSIHQTQLTLTRLHYQQWQQDLFTANWWYLLATLIIPWIVWWYLVRKDRVFEVIAYALLVVFIGTTLDIYGVTLGWWGYTDKLFYLNPGLVIGDWSLPPVTKSLIYQYFPDWPRYLAAQVILAAILSFLLEPLLKVSGVYLLYHWDYTKSFVVYIAVAIAAKLIVDMIKKYAKQEMAG